MHKLLSLCLGIPISEPSYMNMKALYRLHKAGGIDTFEYRLRITVYLMSRTAGIKIQAG